MGQVLLMDLINDIKSIMENALKKEKVKEIYKEGKKLTARKKI